MSLALKESAQVTCEGEKTFIECKPYEVITVKSVMWGRDDYTTCPNVPAGLTSQMLCETNQDAVKKKVEESCKNQQACEISASNIFFDDNTCGNVYKYLRIGHECQPDTANAVDVLLEGGKRRKRKRSPKEKRSFRDS